jgi:iron complex outermembrane receptor protein
MERVAFHVNLALAAQPAVAAQQDEALGSGGISEPSNDVQVEVLEGPQGTLFGRNATGGLIQVRTREPSDTTELSAELGYGNYNTFTGGIRGRVDHGYY